MRSTSAPRYNTFVPALAYTFASNPTEIEVRARGSRRRRIEVFAVPADAAEFRSDDRLLDRADAAVLGDRHSWSRCCRCCSWSSWSCAASSSAPKPEQGVFTLFAIAFLLIGVTLFGVGLLGEYVGPHLRGGAPPAALHRRRGARAREDSHDDAARDAARVVFAYHDVGVRCLRVLLAHGVRCRWWSRTRTLRASTIWFDSVARHARWHGLEVLTPADPNAPELRRARARRAAGFPVLVLLPPRCWARSCWRLPPRGAYNMHGSLLPKYRGRVPVNWAVLHGERETGATLHAMIAQARCRRHRRCAGGADPAGRHRGRGVSQGHASRPR